MSRGKASGRAGDPQQIAAVTAFLRELAARAEADRAFGAHLLEAVQASGLATLLAEGSRTSAVTPTAPPARTGKGAEALGPAASVAAGGFDPFVVLRERGESGLRAALAGLDLASLRQLVRTHRLDPNRVSARWSAHERVVALIVDQVRARANHGKAFARV
jgi:hypothetical protein